MNKLVFAGLVSVFMATSAFAMNDHIIGTEVGGTEVGGTEVGGTEAGIVATSSQLQCSTAPNRFGGFERITVSAQDAYTATIQGMVSGGMAQFVMLVGPFNVKINHDGDTTVYSNDEENVELDVMPVTGGLSASFKSGTAPSVSMNCAPLVR